MKPSMGSFCHYELRTRDVDAARSFYTSLFGERFWDSGVTVSLLPAQAAARGAPSHWLGHIAVDDVRVTAERFVRTGAAPLGPPVGPEASRAILRDPFGAVVALIARGRCDGSEPVAWRHLNADDEVRALAVYADLFGWTPRETFDLGPERGRHVNFSWGSNPDTAGGVSNLATQPGIHPQWLFFFETDDLERSVAAVRRLGGLALPAVEMPGGALAAPCDDAQGAAFGLYETRSR